MFLKERSKINFMNGKGRRKYRFRFVCPPWVRQLRQRHEQRTEGAAVKTRPVTHQSVAMQPSEKTMRLAALEHQSMQNSMRMVDLSGQIVELEAKPRQATKALKNAARTLQQTDVPVLQQPECRQPDKQLDLLQQQTQQLAPYDNAQMAMLRPVDHQGPMTRLLQKRRVARADRASARSLTKAVRTLQQRKKLFRGISVAVGCACGAVALCAALVTVAWYTGLFDGAQHYVEAKEVYFDGRPVGTVTDAETLEASVDSLYEQLSVEYGVDVLANQELEMRDTLVDPKYVSTPDDVADEVMRNIQINVNAVVIDIDGMAAVALESQEDAQWVLDQALAPYTNDEGNTTVGFLEDVEIAQQDVDYSLLRTKEEALQFLTMGVETAQTYTVQSGDTLWSIAEAHGYTVSDLRAANPSLASTDVLSVGQQISLMQPQKLVNVSSEQIIEVTETLPHETQTTTSDSMYSDQQVVQQAGSDGQKVSTIQINYLNGNEVSRTVLSEQITVEPVTEIIVVGTQKRPSNVSAAGYMRPVNGGVITSPFGYRNQPTAGASTYHSGIDIGVGYGTPILATRSGYVTYSGRNGGYGIMVEIDHGDGVKTRYAHCSQTLVSVGQYVSQGQQIAKVGSTGVSTGNHLHFEVRVNGVARNPANYVDF